MVRIAPSATPTPIPAFAPVLKGEPPCVTFGTCAVELVTAVTRLLSIVVDVLGTDDVDGTAAVDNVNTGVGSFGPESHIAGLAEKSGPSQQ